MRYGLKKQFVGCNRFFLSGLKGADPLILVKISLFFFLLENNLLVWGHYVLNFYKAIATRNAPKKGPKNGGYR